jgi:hypothetical protein
MEHHRDQESPKYRYATRLAQAMLDDHPSIAERGEVIYRRS